MILLAAGQARRRRLVRALLLAGALLIASAPLHAAVPPPVAARHGMVVTSQHLASEIGVDVLRHGGNAVDAAVAVGYALAVVHPCCGNIGGGGFMTIHLANGTDAFLDFRETAPLAASRDMYLDAQGNVVPGLSTVGYLSIGVPGTVSGLETARKLYGTMSRAQLMAPAIRLARQGFILHPGDVALLHKDTKAFSTQPNVAAIFLPHGRALEAGERLVQGHLARTLEEISREGPDAFYKGPIAAALVAANKANGGLLRREDFLRYRTEQEKPVRCAYRGFTIVSAPPPSSGGTTLCEILNILEGFPMGKLGFHSAASVHDMVEAMRRAYADRNTYLGDPAFVKNPLDRLLSPPYAAKLRAEIATDRATPSSEVHPGLGGASPASGTSEGVDTTSYSIVDAKGNAVAVTYTINSLFGSKRIAGDTGFFLNDEMDDFTSKPGVPNQFGLVQGEANAIAPGKRPLSSMTPTVVLRNGKIFMVTGSPGGSRIITIVLESILNAVDYGMNAAQAVDAPRIHHQWLPDVVDAEPFALSPDTEALLEKMGYKIVVQAPWGADEAILVDPQSGILYGANDARRPAGLAAGY